jgi:poly-gamma-glutamate capsule biosynthesis protein CapA/YwtB (metallophosphatase superfamily)
VHWGIEYIDTISDSQKSIRDLMLSEGVDAIIGTHPHYLQAMEYDKKKGTFVAYSLGDFMGDGTRAGTNYSVILDLEITKNNRSGETRVTGFSYTPIYTTEGSDGLLRVMRLENAIKAYEEKYLDRVSQSVYEDMKYSLERIEARIHAKVE